LHVSGDLDVFSARDLDARLGRALALHRGDGLVLDLSNVPFMDCAGLGPVLRVRQRLEGRLALRGLQPQVDRLLNLARVVATVRILPPPGLWPSEADPHECRVVWDDLLDHRPSWHAPRREPGVPQGVRTAAAASAGERLRETHPLSSDRPTAWTR
jgi:anti-anti-sigma factor